MSGSVACGRTIDRLSVVIPMHNEAPAIAGLFAALDPVLASIGCAVELICVDDGSTDRTVAVLRDLQQTHRLRVVVLSRNFGKEAAMMAGLAHARGEAAVIIDADLQDPPDLIPAFLAEWRSGSDVVFGIRTSRADDSAFKRWSAQRFYRLFNRFATTRIPEDAGDFRLLDRKVIDAMLALPERNRFTKGLFAWVGFRQKGVPFERPRRVAGITSWSNARLIGLAVDGITSFSVLPLRLASALGAGISILGIGFALFLAIRTIVAGVDVPGYASLMVGLLVLSGAQLLCLGVIGEYLGRLYIEAKQRPLYVVAAVHENPAS